MPTGAPVLLYSSSHYVDDRNTLSLFVRQSDIRQRFPAFQPGRAYDVRATMVLDVGYGGQAGYWTAFMESVFPVRERTQSAMTRVVF